MKEQNFKNHMRLVPGYHGLTFLAIIALLVGSLINLANSASENLYSASLITLVAFILCLLFVYIRSFALRAQDRAIRAEENLRHFVLTGKPIPDGIRMGQVIALRFASNEEFPGLTTRALHENLSNTDIKKAIQHWRADYYRA
ncbi:MAG: DUF6526 family protein [Sediminibacterium sp.]|nr:DUF6526 family protein [Sediminibacterium sp.]MDP1811336.1 DUF6526 family protein [Sediminibacterium sp.]MDP3128071.1 DUF6526 family protein [Sediminibacterium sp.]